MQSWYAVFTKPRGEFQACNALLAKDLEVYLPVVTVKPANPRARTSQAFFARYLFVYADLDVVGRSTIQWTPGVAGLVSAAEKPVPVPPELIDALRKRLENLQLLPSAPAIPYHPGERLVIREGPLQGMDAIFDQQLDAKGRARVLVEMLRRQVPVEIDIESLHKLDPRALAAREARRPGGRVNRRR